MPRIERARVEAVFLVAGLLAGPGTACAQQAGSGSGDSAELARQLANPIASLVSVPLKLDWDTGIGAAGADRATYVMQPVIPVSLNANWNLISRTIVPYVDAQPPSTGLGGAAGLGDITQSFFFSPKAPTAGGWIWGAGPVLLLETATKDALGAGKWGVGPTAVVLRQERGWTYGALANHIWSVAGSDERTRVSATFLQPFLSFTTPTSTTFTVNTESTYDWVGHRWTVPINLSVSQLVRLGTQPVSVSAGIRSYVSRPEGGPDWGLRLTVTFLFPK